ncbi:MAG: metallophosphoesterase [Campylobacterota bacterium]|nr:metallophosphoesterase [Campylobacterota bacterium]
MNRRNFLALSASSLLLSGCETSYSPYTVDTKKHYRNDKNIAQLDELNLQYPIKIALTSDTHTYYNGIEKIFEYMQNKSEYYDLVLHGGDITDAGLQGEYDQYIHMRSSVNLPFVHAVGNHDALTNGKSIFKNEFGLYNFSFKIAQSHIIVFNNNTWEFDAVAYNIEWLEEELEKASQDVNENGGQIIILHHIPYDGHRFSEDDINNYKEMMARFNVSLSINGHLHNHSIDYGSTTYLTIGSPFYENFVELTLESPQKDAYTLEQIFV